MSSKEERFAGIVCVAVAILLFAGVGFYIWYLPQRNEPPVQGGSVATGVPREVAENVEPKRSRTEMDVDSTTDSSSTVSPTSTTAAEPAEAETELADDWDTLPEVGFPEEEAGSVDGSVAREATPTPEPRVTDDSPKGRELPLPDAVWRAGILNGTPRDETDTVSAREYGPDRMDAVVHVRSPAELPPFLHPEQRLVLHLPGLEPGLYTVRVATTGGTRDAAKLEREDKELRNRRHLRIRWNDHLVWSRAVEPVHAITRAVVPPPESHADSNLLTLENIGTGGLPLDAVWVEPYAAGEHPFYVAAEEGEWVNRRAAVWIKNVLVEVPLPGSDMDWVAPGDDEGDEGGDTSGWDEAEARLSRLMEEGHDALPRLREWRRRLGKAVARGMSVGVRVEAGDERDGRLEAAAWVYGGVVSRWVLDRGGDTDRWIEQIRRHAPGAEVVVMHSDVDGAVAGRNRYAWWDYHYWTERAVKRRSFFDGAGSPEALAESLDEVVNLRALFFAYMGRRLAWHSDSVHEVIGDYLMEAERGLILHGMHAGGPFFPAGNDDPSLMWHFLKSVFRFGGPDHRKGIANVLGGSNHRDLGRTTWAVADNGVDSVQVLVHNPLKKNGRKARLELALPWDGPTRMLLHRTQSRWGSRPPASETERVKRRLEPRPFPREEGKPGGWVEVPFTLRGIQLFEFAPEDSRIARENRAPERVGFSELVETDRLFEVKTSPPPAWWSRVKLGAHFSPMWRGSGDVSIQVNVPASKDGVPDWKGQDALHMRVEGEYEAVPPLREHSTRFRFADKRGPTARVMRSGYHRNRVFKGERVGIWLRANPPPGFKPKFDSFHAKPQTHFYMGKLPYRQRIDVEYGKWVFITSDAKHWRHSVSRFQPFLVFWPGDPVDGNPEIEVNAFEVYQSKLEDTDVTPGKCMGFVREDGEGRLGVLVIGVPGRAAFWRQRLPHHIDTEAIRHVVDRELLTTADTPEEDPPEVVRHRLEYFEDARVLELEIERIPEPPSHGHLEELRKAFPLLADEIRTRGLGAVLFRYDPGGAE